MVVALDDENKNAKLSLRQTEILSKLSSIVKDLSSETEDSYVDLLSELVAKLTLLMKHCGTYFSS